MMDLWVGDKLRAELISQRARIASHRLHLLRIDRCCKERTALLVESSHQLLERFMALNGQSAICGGRHVSSWNDATTEVGRSPKERGCQPCASRQNDGRLTADMGFDSRSPISEHTK